VPIERVNGVDLHYLQSGDGDDVLLLCGLGDDVTAWDAQVGPFGERYRVTVVDNRGVGVPGQAHPPFQEDPAAFNETGLEFWASV